MFGKERMGLVILPSRLFLDDLNSQADNSSVIKALLSVTAIIVMLWEAKHDIKRYHTQLNFWSPLE
jgi:hypothetical protein